MLRFGPFTVGMQDVELWCMIKNKMHIDSIPFSKITVNTSVCALAFSDILFSSDVHMLLICRVHC